MALMNATITLKEDLRPVVVKGKKALAHPFVSAGLFPCEMEDGTIYWACGSDVRFLDTADRMGEMAWPEDSEED